MRQRIISITIIIAVIGGLFALFVYNAINGSAIDTTVWNEQMTIGDIKTAKYHYTMYTDIFCPYCDKFSDALMTHWDEFQSEYIEGKGIFFEVRITDMNYLSGHSNNSRPAGEGAYCAAKQGKFWDYYNLAVTSIWNDYFKSSGKAAFSRMSSIGKDYWINIGKQIGLNEDFENCVENEETLAEIKTNAEKTAKLANGMPYFKFNDYTSSGFDLSWGYDYVMMYFQAGLESK